MGSLSGYGENWELPVTKARAKKLLTTQGFREDQLPRMGYEMELAGYADPQWPEYRHRLQLQNVCGCYVLACVSIQAADWHMFKVPGLV